MSAARAFILAILSLAGTLPIRAAQETTAPTSEQTAAAAEAAEKQIRVYRATLAEAKDEQTRLDAATLLLFSDLSGARKELIQALRDDANPLARAAICQALVAAREDRRPVTNKAEFIEPLMVVIRTETNPERAELAAQAILMLSYDDVQRQLEALVDDPNAPKIAVFNAIRAMKYQPDEQALLKLIGLAGRMDTAVSGESKKALSLIGIDVPDDPNGVRALIESLQRKGPEAFITNSLIMRNWLVSRENQNVELRLSLKSLEQHYLDALDKLYNSQSDDKARTDYLAQQLAAAEPAVKLWALTRLDESQKGTGRNKLSDQIKTTLLGLIGNGEKRVRLKTANLLASMWDLNSSQQLLDQLRLEQDPDVRLAVFTALGSVCYSGSQPTSPSKVSEEVRKKTLELAMTFLRASDNDRVKAGADVIRKLLEQDGLKAEEVSSYLKALSERYRQAGANIDRGDLLGAMASLCSQRSVCRTEAGKLYGPVFEIAMGDVVDAVRLAAIDGQVNVNRIEALRRLRKELGKDPSLAVRTKLLELFGDGGGSEDLDLLFPRMGQNGESDAAWKAMSKIFTRSTADVLDVWMTKLDAKASAGLVSYDQKVSFLTLIEQRAQSDRDNTRLKAVRERLFTLYASGNNAAKAADCMKSILSTAGDEVERQAAMTAMTGICLGLPAPNLELAASLVEKYLLDKDLDAQSPLAKSIRLYVNEPPAGADPNALLDKLRQIRVKDPDTRASWRDQMREWEVLVKARKPKEVEKEGK
jgi:hypothetical protein